VDSLPRGVFSLPAVGGAQPLILEDAASPEALPDKSLLVLKFNEQRRAQIHRFWPETGRLQSYPATVPSLTCSEKFRFSGTGKNRLFGEGRWTTQTAIPTASPVTMVGTSEVGFILGSGSTSKLAIASVADGRILRRLERAHASGIQSLAATPDGQTLYCAAAGKIWSIPSHGTPK